jgi:hypothetical protein
MRNRTSLFFLLLIFVLVLLFTLIGCSQSSPGLAKKAMNRQDLPAMRPQLESAQPEEKESQEQSYTADKTFSEDTSGESAGSISKDEMERMSKLEKPSAPDTGEGEKKDLAATGYADDVLTGKAESAPAEAPAGGAGGELEGKVSSDKDKLGAAADRAMSQPPSPELVQKKQVQPQNELAVKADEPSIEEFRIRSKFPEILYYNPTLITDAYGHTSFTFSGQDQITDYTLRVDAATKSGDWGFGSSTFRVFQPLFTDLETPDKLRVNDSISLSALVFNYSGKTLPVNARIEISSNLVLSSPKTVSMNIPPSKNAVIPISLKAANTGNGALTIYLSSGELKDAIRKTISILPDKHENTIRQEGVVDSGRKNITLSVPSDAIVLPDDAIITIISDPSFGALEHYRNVNKQPHASLISSLSMFISAVFAYEQFEKNAMLSNDLKKELHDAIDTSWLRLLAFRNSNGFAFYPGGKADKQANLLVLDSLNRINEIWVDPKIIEILSERADGIFTNKAYTTTERLIAACTLLEGSTANKNLTDSINEFINDPLIMNSSDPVTLPLAYRCASKLGLKLDFTRAIRMSSQTASPAQLQNVQTISQHPLDSNMLFTNYSFLLALSYSKDKNKGEYKSMSDDLSRIVSDSVYSELQSPLDKINAIIALSEFKKKVSASHGKTTVKVNGKEMTTKSGNLVSEFRISLKKGENLIEIASDSPGTYFSIKGRYFYDTPPSGNANFMDYKINPKVKANGTVDAELAILDPVSLFKNHTVIHLPIPFGIKPVDTPRALARRIDADYVEIKSDEIIVYYNQSEKTVKSKYTIPLVVESMGDFFVEAPSVDTQSGSIQFTTQGTSRLRLV